MTRYRVSVENASGSAGIGESIIEAPSEDDAKVIFAGIEGMTVETLSAGGLNTWKVVAA